MLLNPESLHIHPNVMRKPRALAYLNTHREQVVVRHVLAQAISERKAIVAGVHAKFVRRFQGARSLIRRRVVPKRIETVGAISHHVIWWRTVVRDVGAIRHHVIWWHTVVEQAVGQVPPYAIESDWVDVNAML